MLRRIGYIAATVLPCWLDGRLEIVHITVFHIWAHLRTVDSVNRVDFSAE